MFIHTNFLKTFSSIFFALFINIMNAAETKKPSSPAKNNIGDIEHPIIMAMVPGLDNIILNENGIVIQKCLEELTQLHFKLVIPTNFIAVVEALGTKRIDVALMNTYGYILANEKYQAHARLIGTFKGQSEYWGQIIALESGPKSLSELNGKTFAFVDPASTSGFILPQKTLEDEKIKIKNRVFAGKHDAVVTMVYQGRVDAGATYHTKPVEGIPQDARTLVKTQYPDVLEKVKILKVIGPIPSDPIVIGNHVPGKIDNAITTSMKKCAMRPEVIKAYMNTYHLDGLKDATDSTWEGFRTILKQIESEKK